jgi:excinuclease ABC subunit A
LIKHYKINKDKPIEDLTDKQLEIILKGSDEPISYTIESSNGNIYKKTEYIEGVSEMIKRRHIETTSEGAREFYSRYMSEITCPVCKGKKLSKAALSVKINDKNIIDVTDLTIDEAIDFFLNLQLTQNQKFIANLALKEIVSRLSFLKEVGLEYITLSRSANTLSGGEAQRIRLATQIGSSLTGILYVLDEPSIGLHQKDNAMLIKALKNMRDLGNTLIVVEHDLETIEESDYIIDVGPGAGNNGGNITATGNLEEIKNNKNSLTGKYLKGEYFIPIPSKRRSGDGRVITIKGAKENNLKNVDVSIPLGKFICVTGVSGSGKSTLVETLTTNIQKSLFNPFISAPKIKSLTGHNDIEKIIFVSQEPIGRTPRSNPATYIGLFDDIRELYAQLPESKARG